MHTGIGVDIEGIERFAKIDLKNHGPFLMRVYTKKELQYCLSKKNPAPHLAVRFAGKEAVIKALSSIAPHKKCKPAHIEIDRTEQGAPRVLVHEAYFKGCVAFISLSHSSTMAVATALVIRHEGHFLCRARKGKGQ